VAEAFLSAECSRCNQRENQFLSD